MGILVYGIPIVLGLACGYIFSLPVNIGLAAVALAIGGGLLWSTRNAELGGLIGVIAAIEAGIFLASQWIMIAVLGGLSIDLSWMLRASP